MNETANESEGIQQPPKGCLWVLAAVVVLFLLSLAFPSIIWDGATWITIHVEVHDAATGKPIAGAVVTLETERRTKFPEAEVRSATIISAQTDERGRATLKEMFPAGGDQSGTGAHVGTSSVHCEAAGYAPADISISDTGKLRFRKFLFYEQSHSTTLRLAPQHR